MLRCHLECSPTFPGDFLSIFKLLYRIVLVICLFGSVISAAKDGELEWNELIRAYLSIKTGCVFYIVRFVANVVGRI